MVKRIHEQAQASARRIRMERIAIEIGVIIVVFIIGYWSGFRACFDYLMEEVKEGNKLDK